MSYHVLVALLILCSIGANAEVLTIELSFMISDELIEGILQVKRHVVLACIRGEEQWLALFIDDGLVEDVLVQELHGLHLVGWVVADESWQLHFEYVIHINVVEQHIECFGLWTFGIIKQIEDEHQYAFGLHAALSLVFLELGEKLDDALWSLLLW